MKEKGKMISGRDCLVFGDDSVYSGVLFEYKEWSDKCKDINKPNAGLASTLELISKPTERKASFFFLSRFSYVSILLRKCKFGTELK